MKPAHLRLVDDVVLRLEDSILSGELQPGDRLLVLPLASQFGMSQSTIREALLMLEQRGLVRTRPRRGASVSRLTTQEALEICQARALLESHAAAVGVPGLAEETLASLRTILQAAARCRIPRDLPQVIRHDRAFHEIIISLADSGTLRDLWSSLNSRMGALIMRTQQEKQIDVRQFVRYHEEVVAALETRDPERACHELVRHYLRGFDVPALEFETLRSTAAQAQLLQVPEQSASGISAASPSKQRS